MKKNRLLYILLAFLILVNSVFLFLFLNKPPRNGGKSPGDFIAKELRFNEVQMHQYRELEMAHEVEMRAIRENLKDLKETLFEKVNQATVSNSAIDSIANLIGGKEALKDQKTYYHLRAVHEICDDEQKEKFDAIVKGALQRGDGGNRPPPPRP